MVWHVTLKCPGMLHIFYVHSIRSDVSICCFKPWYCLINSQAVVSFIKQSSPDMLRPGSATFGIPGQPNVIMVKLYSLQTVQLGLSDEVQ